MALQKDEDVIKALVGRRVGCFDADGKLEEVFELRKEHQNNPTNLQCYLHQEGVSQEESRDLSGQDVFDMYLGKTAIFCFIDEEDKKIDCFLPGINTTILASFNCCCGSADTSTIDQDRGKIMEMMPRRQSSMTARNAAFSRMAEGETRNS